MRCARVDLADCWRALEPFARARVLIAYQCCLALACRPRQGIVHRDLKPENIFVIEREGAADFVKIVDFARAK